MIRKIICMAIAIFGRFYFKINIVNYERFAKLKSGCILAPNHISPWETILVPATSKRLMYMMAKEELFSNAFYRWFWKTVKAFPVGRGKNDIGAIKTAIKLLRSGNAVCMFPEGTRNKEGEMLPFKTGVTMIAHSAKVPVIPVGIVSDLKFRSKFTIVYGEPIYFDELYDKKLTKEELEAATAKIQDAVKKAIASVN
ncbi:MAG: 1-acyl-sn-glycerol-3-phosphate acyltransferase [Clostridia bacterium]|nr:1-acyl-sn-glycerol-3-phosphate acyltransferase [Clostridia bacterium]